MQTKPANARRAVNGFTRLELIVILATLLVVAGVLRPVWGSTGATRSMVCMDNLRRLSAAWLLFADDNGGTLVGNYHGGFVPGPNAKERPWATGWMDWTTSYNNTNTTYLTNPRYAALAPHLGRDSTVFRCPADEYLSSVQVGKGWTARVRSYSMNCYMGEGNVMTGPAAAGYVQHKKLSDFRQLSPQQVFVLLEEHPDSINDPMFFIPNSEANWVELPGAFHDGGCWFTFADGHLEQRRWRSAEILRPVVARDGSYSINVAGLAGGPDLLWVRAHTTKVSD